MSTAIHPTAVVHKTAVISDDVEIGPYAVIEAGVRIGARTRIMPHAFVGRSTTLGEDNVLHPGAIVGHSPQDISCTGEEDACLIVGDRNTFREYSTVHRGSRDGSSTVIGNDYFIMAQAHVAHDCKIGDRLILAGGALLAGHVHVEDKAFISGNAAVHQFCKIGTLSFVAGLARVSRDPPPFLLVKGDSLVYGINRVGLDRAGFSEQERQDVRKAYKLLYRKGLRLNYALQKIRDTLSYSPHALHLVDFVQKSERGICTHARKGTPRS